MTRLGQVFWTVAALDAVALLVLWVATLQSKSGYQDGGRAMGLFFFVMVPAVVLMLTMLAFRFVDLRPVRYLALFVVTGPALVFVWMQVDDLRIDRSIAEHVRGAGFFRGASLRAMGVAVVDRDVATIRRLAPTVDVNTPGEDDMTLLKLAVDGPYGMPRTGPDAARLERDDGEVVAALLAAGAKPDRAMVSATKRADLTVLRLLLDAGGDPNLRERDEPLVFAWLSVMTPDALRLLASRGLDLDTTRHGDPLAVVLAIHRRHDLLAVLIELGGDTKRPRPDGRDVRDELAGQMAEAVRDGQELPEDLRKVAAALQVAPSMPAR